MGKLWTVSSCLADKLKIRRTRLFLVFTGAVFFLAGAAAAGLPGAAICESGREFWTLTLCFGGYMGIFPGYFGGLIYMMRREECRDLHSHL